VRFVLLGPHLHVVVTGRVEVIDGLERGVGVPKITVTAPVGQRGWRARWRIDPATMRPGRPSFLHGNRRTEPSTYVWQLARWTDDTADELRDLLEHDRRTADRVLELDVQRIAERGHGLERVDELDGDGQLVTTARAVKPLSAAHRQMLERAAETNARTLTRPGSAPLGTLLADWRVDPSRLRSSRGRRPSVDHGRVLELRERGMGATQIAARLGVPRGTVASVLSRANRAPTS